MIEKINLRALFSLIFIFSFTGVFAQNYVVVGKDGKVFDEANTKYVTLNQKNDEVTVIPGMVFKSLEKSPGWFQIEYSPGLRAYIPEQICVAGFKTPVAGEYSVKNSPSNKVSISQSGNEWTVTDSKSTYKGNNLNNILVFFDESKNPVYSYVDMGDGPVIINYANSVTNFF